MHNVHCISAKCFRSVLAARHDGCSGLAVEESAAAIYAELLPRLRSGESVCCRSSGSSQHSFSQVLSFVPPACRTAICNRIRCLYISAVHKEKEKLRLQGLQRDTLGALVDHIFPGCYIIPRLIPVGHPQQLLPMSRRNASKKTRFQILSGLSLSFSHQSRTPMQNNARTGFVLRTRDRSMRPAMASIYSTQLSSRKPSQ